MRLDERLSPPVFDFSEDGFTRLCRTLLGNGFLKREVRFAECVDNGLAEAAVGEQPNRASAISERTQGIAGTGPRRPR